MESISEKECVGRMAVSLAGRDKGSVLVIIGTDADGTVLVSDGRRRRLERPKRKKMKHLRLLGTERRFSEEIPPEAAGQFTNRTLRKAVAKVSAQEILDA